MYIKGLYLADMRMVMYMADLYPFKLFNPTLSKDNVFKLCNICSMYVAFDHDFITCEYMYIQLVFYKYLIATCSYLAE